jgi:Phage tail sheath C-terminal domain/Phage tail sheath protein subtilisin-like domain
MAEDFSLSELVIPGVFIRVRPDALIGVGGISTGNIGMVGFGADDQQGTTHSFSDYQSAQAIFGSTFGHADASLAHALALLFQNGARQVYVRAVASGANATDLGNAFSEVLKEDVNILVAPELPTDQAKTILGAALTEAENNQQDVIAVIGSDANTVATITDQVVASPRVILATPAIAEFDAATNANVAVPGQLTAAVVAGLLSTLTPQTSPTNQVLPGVGALAQRFSYGDTKTLISGGALVLEQRAGVRVVRGVTTDMKGNGAFRQITTRRITNFAKAGIRQAAGPFIGRLNNERVRKALQGAINGFLTTMVQDEALIDYTLDVTASRDDEINNRAIVNAIIRPTFSIDFVAVTLVLQ